MIQWRKSSHSQGEGQGDCVEVSTNAVDTLIRDSKNPDGPRLSLSRTGLTVLLGQIKAGDLDL
ncbi:DUF397 domain-containing protein [Actinomadura sp. NEAU-AAG7]|uniref:DUF397 domain-containing protein n=1 Tax=Actinomadura sp. NEAU-AAG7 TaxID=2839640 RepID=UPI001BE3DC34|nr:DUF397 domain-containing protein [Actinomadura sp. NEAU-AAG7]MBT2208930.1 DUF397 domain-containing protein [Actinomadura sp. NEAU-AAG7]